jgi:hypothetical protein
MDDHAEAIGEELTFTDMFSNAGIRGVERERHATTGVKARHGNVETAE